MKNQPALCLLAVASVLLAVAGGCAPKEPEKTTSGDPRPVNSGPQNSGNPDLPKNMPAAPQLGSTTNPTQRGPSTASSSTSTTADACLKNAKQLALGIMMFCADNNDKIQMSAGDWAKKIQPYVKDMKIFTCPDDRSGESSYSFNGALTGKSQASIVELANTVLVYEGKNGQLDFRHGGRAVVALADGHAKLVSKDEATKLLWKP
jgi:prepilin-type processing-associated H-X9-DG protein